MNPISNSHWRSRASIAVGVTSILVLGACASVPPAPSGSLQAAHEAIANAERTEAGRYAPAELSEARVKLGAADTAVAEQKMSAAEQFAQEARVEANLASAKTADIKAQAVNAEMMRSNGTLIDEMQRKAGDKP